MSVHRQGENKQATIIVQKDRMDNVRVSQEGENRPMDKVRGNRLMDEAPRNKPAGEVETLDKRASNNKGAIDKARGNKGMIDDRTSGIDDDVGADDLGLEIRTEDRSPDTVESLNEQPDPSDDGSGGEDRPQNMSDIQTGPVDITPDTNLTHTGSAQTVTSPAQAGAQAGATSAQAGATPSPAQAGATPSPAQSGATPSPTMTNFVQTSAVPTGVDSKKPDQNLRVEQNTAESAESVVDDDTRFWNLKIGTEVFCLPVVRLKSQLPGLYVMLQNDSSSDTETTEEARLLGDLKDRITPTRHVVKLADDEFMLDADPTMFGYILHWLRGSRQYLETLSPTQLSLLRFEAQSFGVMDLARQVSWFLCDQPDILDPIKCDMFRGSAGLLHRQMTHVRGSFPLVEALVAGTEQLKHLHNTSVVKDMDPVDREILGRRNWDEMVTQLMKQPTVQRFFLRNPQPPTETDRQRCATIELQVRMILQALQSIRERYGYPMPKLDPLVKWTRDNADGPSRAAFLSKDAFIKYMSHHPIDGELQTSGLTHGNPESKQVFIDQVFDRWMMVLDRTAHAVDEKSKGTIDVSPQSDGIGQVFEWLFAAMGVLGSQYLERKMKETDSPRPKEADVNIGSHKRRHRHRSSKGAVQTTVETVAPRAQPQLQAPSCEKGTSAQPSVADTANPIVSIGHGNLMVGHLHPTDADDSQTSGDEESEMCVGSPSDPPIVSVRSRRGPFPSPDLQSPTVVPVAADSKYPAPPNGSTRINGHSDHGSTDHVASSGNQRMVDGIQSNVQGIQGVPTGAVSSPIPIPSPSSGSLSGRRILATTSYAVRTPPPAVPRSPLSIAMIRGTPTPPIAPRVAAANVPTLPIAPRGGRR